MKPRIHDDRNRPDASRPWQLAVFLLIALVPAACSAPAGSEPEAAAAGLLEAPAASQGSPAGGQSLVDSEDLLGLGELGLLPSLLQSLGTGTECDFDDAFSTCQ